MPLNQQTQRFQVLKGQFGAGAFVVQPAFAFSGQIPLELRVELANVVP